MTAEIHRDPRIVDRRLRQYFDTDRQQLIEIIKASVAARAQSTDDSPMSAASYYAWAAATMRLRQIFRRTGWEKGYENGIETVIERERKKQIAVMSTDSGTADINRSPRNRTIKGPASGKVVDLNNQYELFNRDALGPHTEPPYSLWYLCIYDNGSKVRAELSRPIEFTAGYISKFIERIFILEDGDWEKVILAPPDNRPAHDDDLRIDVRRK